MILSAKQIIKLKLVNNLLDQSGQVQPCGVDFTLKKVSVWKDSGIIDFDNSKRKLAQTEILKFKEDGINLPQGGYLIEFNETVTMPLNIMGTLQTRSSLFRVGASLQAGVIEPSYNGAVGAMLQVWNNFGITLLKNAKLGQWIFSEIMDPDEKGYEGVYQNAEKII